jgi:hypothetical protein
LLTHTKPERATERNPRLRQEWWLFEANRPELRRAIAGLGRYAVTVENSPVRAFVFLDEAILPDQKLRVVASNDAMVLGVLSSRPHTLFAKRLGGRHGVANTPVYNSRCFATFPFPACTDAQAARIRELGEQLDAHRKRQQAAHPTLTITGMYNVLEKLRRDEPLTDKEKVVHEQGLVSVLRQLHDDLDAAVFDAYGWPRDLSDEQILEKLVALNAERAEEERQGLVRWLRPDFQNPGGARAAQQVALAGTEEAGAEEEGAGASASAGGAAAAPRAWPKKLGERIAIVRELLASSKRLWSTAEVAGAFKGAKKPDVEELLEGLAGIGAVGAVGSAKARRWGAGTRAG